MDYPSQRFSLSFPSDLDQLRSLASQLHQLKEDHYGRILLVFAAAYLYKQTFAIPGSVFLNILGGALFGVWVALPLVCVLTACGASLCYLLSWAFGRAVVMRYLGHRIAPVQDRLRSSHGVDLLLVLLSLRLFPMSPNWLLNLASPLLGVPLPLFFISVLFGLLPYNFLCVQSGIMLAELRGVVIWDPTSISLLLLGTVLLLATGLGMRYLTSRRVDR